MMIIFALLASTALALPRAPISRIVNGVDSNPGQWPWQASLQYSTSNNPSHICGGALISDTLVLTAAHCVQHSSNVNNYQIVLGEHQLSKTEGNEQKVGISSITLHSNYNQGSGNYPNDIAIIRLSERADLTNDAIKPVSLPQSGQEFINEECYISGWGKTSANSGAADILQHTDMDVMTNTACRDVWGRTAIISSHICLAAPTSSACNGDSGGPLVCKKNNEFVLAGVTSWGSSYCHTYPNVYTRITSFLSWIQSNSK